ncbi:hypothetical protein OCU04_010358 [Sclerotinia nivalis]|uniref:Uncharacterized protein n=1 Tax=Sclerotinia nivalis TaxID=352851 RepID=A0A9X0AED7_9HELO|nr:hypothetical protein OCU04_010358 [Sclerotinia nivalis]
MARMLAPIVRYNDSQWRAIKSSTFAFFNSQSSISIILSQKSHLINTKVEANNNHPSLKAEDIEIIKEVIRVHNAICMSLYLSIRRTIVALSKFPNSNGVESKTNVQITVNNTDPTPLPQFQNSIRYDERQVIKYFLWGRSTYFPILYFNASKEPRKNIAPFPSCSSFYPSLTPPNP